MWFVTMAGLFYFQKYVPAFFWKSIGLLFLYMDEKFLENKGGWSDIVEKKYVSKNVVLKNKYIKKVKSMYRIARFQQK